MPTYVYQCPEHGRVEVKKPMGQAGREEWCFACFVRSAYDGTYLRAKGQQPMRRVWAVPNLIVRPHGFHLRPGEKGYWDIDRALEVGHVPAPDANSHLGAGAPSDAALEADEYAGVAIPQPTEDGLQKLHEVFRATFSESGSGSRL